MGLHVLYIKHNLFHTTPIARDVELQLTHVLLFQSPYDINQFKRPGQQLRKQKIQSFCYKEATSKPFRFLMIDLSPKTLEILRFSTSLEPTNFYIPSKRPAIQKLTMTTEQFFTLQHFTSLSLADRLDMLKGCEDDFIEFLVESVVNILQGVVPGIRRKDIEKFKPQIVRIISTKATLAEQRAIFTSRKGLLLLDVFIEHVLQFFSNL